MTTGSTLAAQRETDKISFSTLFGGEGIADTYLKNLVEMANNTPFLYDDLTGMSKTLAAYSYEADSILPVLQTIGDAGAALGQSASDMTAVATAIGRMKSSSKTTLEYLNILNDRGDRRRGHAGRRLRRGSGKHERAQPDTLTCILTLRSTEKGLRCGGTSIRTLLTGTVSEWTSQPPRQYRVYKSASRWTTGLWDVRLLMRDGRTCDLMLLFTLYKKISFFQIKGCFFQKSVVI